MIIAITDRSLLDENISFEDRVLELIESQVTYVILREKDWDGQQLTSFLLNLMGRSDLTCRKIVVHSQVAAARHLGLTYVHLPESRIDEPQKSHTKYSYSVHSLDALEKINNLPSLFNLISPVSQTTCKPGGVALNEKVIKEALQIAKAPLVALGGIDVSSAQKWYDFGFKHVALRSELMLAKDVNQIIDQYENVGF